MSRRLRTILIVVLVLLVAGAAALLVLGRSRLDDASSQADDAWKPLRTPLSGRYLRLAAADAALRENGGGDRAVARDLQRQLERWRQLQRDDSPDADAEVRAANDLEGTGQRLAAVVGASARLEAVKPLIAEYQGATVPEPAVQRYNELVRDYQDTRDNVLWGPSATVFGFEARPTFAVAG